MQRQVWLKLGRRKETRQTLSRDRSLPEDTGKRSALLQFNYQLHGNLAENCSPVDCTISQKWPVAEH